MTKEAEGGCKREVWRAKVEKLGKMENQRTERQNMTLRQNKNWAEEGVC